jgi:hypothetical protein
MSITVTAPIIVAVAGLLIYALPTPTKIGEVGRLAFACGLLAALLGLR